MRRKTSLSHEKLVEETRFVLANLQRDDVFGSPAQVAEVERVLEPSLSLPFSELAAFLAKYGYVRLQLEVGTIAVTSGGAAAADAEDPELAARLARHFARELSAAAPRPRAEPSLPPRTSELSPPSSLGRRSLLNEASFNEVLDRRYRRTALLGRGPLGQVHRGRHTSIDRFIAIKEVSTIFQLVNYLRREEIVSRLRDAVQAHAALVHPHIIPIFDQNTDREHPYFVMELAVGGNLRQRLEASSERRLELEVAVRYLSQMAEALRYAHAQDVLHLGLKPENILFDALGNVKLADFGLGRILEPEGEGVAAPPVLLGGNAVGYFAPERLQPGAPPEMRPAADIYALGICFYEMLTGRLPGRRSPLPSQARDGVPEAFDEVFDRMTRDDLSERYVKMEDVLEGIQTAFDSDMVGPPGTVLAWAEDPGPVPDLPEESLESPEPADDEEVEAAPPSVVERAPRRSNFVSDLGTERAVGGERAVLPPERTLPPPERPQLPPPERSSGLSRMTAPPPPDVPATPAPRTVRAAPPPPPPPMDD